AVAVDGELRVVGARDVERIHPGVAVAFVCDALDQRSRYRDEPRNAVRHLAAESLREDPAVGETDRDDSIVINHVSIAHFIDHAPYVTELVESQVAEFAEHIPGAHCGLEVDHDEAELGSGLIQASECPEVATVLPDAVERQHQWRYRPGFGTIG